MVLAVKGSLASNKEQPCFQQQTNYREYFYSASRTTARTRVELRGQIMDRLIRRYVPTHAGLKVKYYLAVGLLVVVVSCMYYQAFFYPLLVDPFLAKPSTDRKYFLSVVAIFKNEADVMKEWIDHHLQQGVDHFFLVNHNSTDNFSSILSRYGRNKITVLNDTRMYSQVKIMNELIHKIKRDTDWIMSIDLDEYMYVRQTSQSKQYGSTVSSALSVIEKENNLSCQILVNWIIFGSSGHIEQPPSVRMNFTHCNPSRSHLTKFIIKSNDFVNYGVHHSSCKGERWLNQCLTEHKMKCNLSEAVLALNHYPIMSWERFKRVKMTRGDVNLPHAQDIRDENYFRNYDKMTDEHNFCFEMADIVISGLNTKKDNDTVAYRLEEYPSILKEPKTCVTNYKLTNFLTTGIQIGWDNNDGAPDWLITMCPEVVDHFNRFPMYRETPTFNGTELPIQSTNYAAQAVCTMKVVKLLSASVQARLYLHAGSHLGAIVHGQPIPWDDDVDMWLDFEKKQAFLEACDLFQDILEYPKQVNLRCVVGFNALKVWLQPKGMKKVTHNEWCSPYVDLFLFKINNGRIQEVNPKGAAQPIGFDVKKYFPTQPFYFGGIYLFGPHPQVAETRYKVQDCVMSGFNHRLEAFFPSEINRCIDCQELHKLFPFVYNNTYIKVFGGDDEQKLYPPEGSVSSLLTETSTEQRNHWFQASDSKGQQLTNNIPNLDVVEIDNTISPLDECSFNKLKVIEFNVERGRRWLESTELLRDADVIILNEMDIGMVRTDQQHTARLMAYFLEMNYAWGLEFVELTLGDKEDRMNIGPNEENFYGLHGNAILSKCKIFNATIFRNTVSPYFSDTPNDVNANGMEKRLGGRMIMLSRIIVNGASVAIGNTQKLDGFRKEVKNYINGTSAIIAGNQHSSFCGDVGLDLILSDPKHYTWRASCTTFGHGRGDNICSNMKVAEKEYIRKPCITYHGLNVPLGDHSLTGAAFEIP